MLRVEKHKACPRLRMFVSHVWHRYMGRIMENVLCSDAQTLKDRKKAVRSFYLGFETLKGTHEYDNLSL